MTEPTIETVVVPGGRLWTATQGAGIPVVLCHGGPGLSDNLGTVAAMVDDLALVHRYDQRGSSRSPSDGPFDVESFLADLEQLRCHWGHERWVVAGHSWGANLALFYATAYPDRTLAVIYICGTGLSWGWQARANEIRRARLTEPERAELDEIAAELKSGNTGRQDRFLRLMWSTDFADRATARVLDTQPLYAFPRNEQVFAETSRSHKEKLDEDIRDDIRELPMPILVLHGALDTDPDRAHEVAELAPRGHWVQLDNAAHSPWLEQPALMREQLRAFIRSATPA